MFFINLRLCLEKCCLLVNMRLLYATLLKKRNQKIELKSSNYQFSLENERLKNNNDALSINAQKLINVSTNYLLKFNN